MGMFMGMGHWLLWIVVSIIAVFALAGLIGWMRREKQRTVANAHDNAQTLAGITDAPAHASSGMPQSPRPSHDQARHQGWGFWPWALLSLLVTGGLGWLVWHSSMAPGASDFQWVSWTLLPMAGLIAILGISQMTRRHPLVDEKKGRPRGVGFLTLISGLILGLASWFVWQPKVDGFAGLPDSINMLQAEKDGLASKLTSRNTIIERLQGDAKEGAAKYAELEKDIRANSHSADGEISRLTGVISTLRTQLNASKTAGSDDTSRLTARIKALTSTNENTDIENTRVRSLLKAYRNDSEVQSAKVAALEAELKDLRNQPAPATLEPATRTIVKKRPTPLAMMHRYNQDETKLRLTSGDYNMAKLGNSELVNGNRGSYYKITLRNPADGKPYRFASGSYSKITNDTQFKQSLDRVISDIRGAFDDKRAYQIYVQGKASAGVYSGEMADGFDYSNVDVLKNLDGSYGPDLLGRTYGPVKITNDDLPDLRGAFLQEFIAKNYKVTKPVILEGRVSKSKRPSNRPSI